MEDGRHRAEDVSEAFIRVKNEIVGPLFHLPAEELGEGELLVWEEDPHRGAEAVFDED